MKYNKKKTHGISLNAFVEIKLRTCLNLMKQIGEIIMNKKIREFLVAEWIQKKKVQKLILQAYKLKSLFQKKQLIFETWKW